MVSEETKRYWSRALYWGLELGADVVTFCLIGSWLWDREFSVTSFAPCMIIAVVIMLGQYDFARSKRGMRYSELLLAGIVMGMAGSLIVDLYVSVYMKMLHPEYIGQLAAQSEVILRQMRIYSEDTIQEAMEVADIVMVPAMMASVTIFYTFVSLIFSAVSALMVWWRSLKNNSKDKQQ